VTDPPARDEAEASAFTESILDNLSAWTVVSLQRVLRPRPSGHEGPDHRGGGV